jgi:UPF0148 protein
MAAKKEDEIMAEYLLKGGKMLEKTCRQCGCPQFEYKGKVFCVVCAEREQEKRGTTSPQGGTEKDQLLKEGKSPQAPAARPEGERIVLDDEIAAAIYNLCARIRTEDDPEQCLVLMDAVKIGTEALQIVRQL